MGYIIIKSHQFTLVVVLVAVRNVWFNTGWKRAGRGSLIQALDFKNVSIKKAEKKVPLGAIKWLQIPAFSPFLAGGAGPNHRLAKLAQN